MKPMLKFLFALAMTFVVFPAIADDNSSVPIHVEKQPAPPSE